MHAILPSYVWKYAYTYMYEPGARLCLDFRFVICKQAIVLGITMKNCTTNSTTY